MSEPIGMMMVDRQEVLAPRSIGNGTIYVYLFCKRCMLYYDTPFHRNIGRYKTFYVYPEQLPQGYFQRCHSFGCRKTLTEGDEVLIERVSTAFELMDNLEELAWPEHR